MLGMSKQAERQRAKDRQRDEKERHEFIRKRERNGDDQEIYQYMYIERFVSMNYINIECSPVIQWFHQYMYS